MRIYLDTCFLNRPFDNQTDDRIRLETEALKIVLTHIDSGDWILISSSVLDLEISKISDASRREAIEELLSNATTARVDMDDKTTELARQIQELGISGFDALHIALAEKAKADVLVTTDDRLVRRSARSTDFVAVKVTLPLRWLNSIADEEGEIL